MADIQDLIQQQLNEEGELTAFIVIAETERSNVTKCLHVLKSPNLTPWQHLGMVFESLKPCDMPATEPDKEDE